ncbi:hypothetical protein JHK82_022968 [Glycine max]|uniref:Uncharacterized protein n=2 Tax=Glycine subgen. Soja TaxID=1462606 RepID=A0A0R0J007_SOYBN|nr:hypothetical protein JHK87_022888 [Glycine soja]KAG5017345.1 hypothetical protein JHK85_023481 [Glycine max]KAG5027098.1 hypothetical protein JHK86_023012 [Glycine max]KAG5138237.1 hypothetical protein JHK82_022968 [Glycine max]KAH1053799.1 hypothetical protein GYH30_022847 [Glycine max]
MTTSPSAARCGSTTSATPTVPSQTSPPSSVALTFGSLPTRRSPLTTSAPRPPACSTLQDLLGLRNAVLENNYLGEETLNKTKSSNKRENFERPR